MWQRFCVDVYCSLGTKCGLCITLGLEENGFSSPLKAYAAYNVAHFFLGWCGVILGVLLHIAHYGSCDAG
jgi:hypothetical protein